MVGTPTGEGSLPAQAVDALSKKPKVYIQFDADATGQKGSREVAKSIGLDRAYIVNLPAGIHDTNEFLTTGGTHEEFQQLISAAKQLDVPTIYNFGQALDRLEEQMATDTRDQAEEMTPWSTVNVKVGTWAGGNLNVVSGPQGTGKTTWCLNVAWHWALNGYSSLFYCLEMNLDELVQHILCAHYQTSESQIDHALIALARTELADTPLYFGANPRLAGIKDVTELFMQAVRRYGLRLVVFDNLHMPRLLGRAQG